MKAMDLKRAVVDGKEYEVESIRFTLNELDNPGKQRIAYVHQKSPEYSDDVEVKYPFFSDRLKWNEPLEIKLPDDDVEKNLIMQAINDSLRETQPILQVFCNEDEDPGKINAQLRAMGVEEDVND